MIGCAGPVFSQESLDKMSARQKGEQNTFYGKHHTEESKQKIRAANTGKKRTEESKQRMRMAQKKWKEDKKKNLKYPSINSSENTLIKLFR